MSTRKLPLKVSEKMEDLTVTRENLKRLETILDFFVNIEKYSGVLCNLLDLSA